MAFAVTNFAAIYMEPSYLENWQNDLSCDLILVVGAGVMLLLVGSGVIGWLRRRLQAKQLLEGLQASVPGGLDYIWQWDRAGFVAETRKSLEPFVRFQVVCQPQVALDALGWIQQLWNPTSDLLALHAILPAPPEQELIWTRGQPPERMLGRDPDREVWTHQRLDFAHIIYGTRGLNAAPLRYVFGELVARFHSILEQVWVHRESDVHVGIVMHASRTDAEQLPAVIVALRALGRAALHK
jgi:hypothetical protein